MAHLEEAASDTMITGVIIIYDPMASILFDLNSIFFMRMKFSIVYDFECKYLDAPIYVSTIVRVFVCVDCIPCVFCDVIVV